MDIPTTVDNTAKAYEVAKTCIGRLQLPETVCLCASSRRLKHACTTQLLAGDKQLAHQLLLQAVKDCPSMSQEFVNGTIRGYEPYVITKQWLLNLLGAEELLGQATPASDCPSMSQEFVNGLPFRNTSTIRGYEPHVHAVHWLLNLVGAEELLGQATPASAATATAIFNTRYVQQPMVDALVRSGLSIQYKQLIAAARHGVPWAENWVMAALQLDMPISSSIPAYIKDFCNMMRRASGRKLRIVPNNLAPTEMADLLHLSLNTKCGSSMVPFGWAPADLCEHPSARALSAEQLLGLLTHAAEARDFDDLDNLASLPAAHELDATASAGMVHTIIDNHRNVLETTRYVTFFLLPGVQQPDKDVVFDLLVSAVEAVQVPVLVQLCQLPAGREIARERVLDLVAKASSVWPSYDVEFPQELLIVDTSSDSSDSISSVEGPPISHLLQVARSTRRHGQPGLAAAEDVDALDGIIFPA